MADNPPTDLDLLAMRAQGLVDRSIGVRFDRTATQDALDIAAAVPAHLVPALRSTWNGVRHPGDPTTRPPLLDACEGLLRGAGWNVAASSACLVYAIDPRITFDSDVNVVRSDRSIPSWIRQANPGNWEAVEWIELVDGKLGPWAMATHDQQVVSITHTPTPLTDRSVEAGAWTDPGFRGRGYAAAVTAAWADVLRPFLRRLFYSTGLDNPSSQRVAARLGLRLLGYQWFLGNRGLEDDADVHRSSSLRR